MADPDAFPCEAPGPDGAPALALRRTRGYGSACGNGEEEDRDMMATFLWIGAGAAVVLVALYGIGVYNTVVRLVREIRRNFGNLESILKQRHDELPKLVNVCQAYMQHERGLLEEITRLRAGYDAARTPEEKIRVENELNQRLARLNVALEAYPELRASEHFAHVQTRISALEEDLNDQRQLFNESVTQYNIFVMEFPALLLTRPLGYLEKPLLEIPEAEQRDHPAPFPLRAA
jgi:LemA protein